MREICLSRLQRLGACSAEEAHLFFRRACFRGMHARCWRTGHQQRMHGQHLMQPGMGWGCLVQGTALAQVMRKM